MGEKHKKNNLKNIFILVLSMAILVLGILFAFRNSIMDAIVRWNDKGYDATYHEGNTEVAMENALVRATESSGGDPISDAAKSCEGTIFYGDIGYLIKGALKNTSAKVIYDNLPDTIALVHYGDQLERLGDSPRFRPLTGYGERHPLTVYLKLVAQGDVELLRLLPNRQGMLEVADPCDFDLQYGYYFDPDVDAERDTPIAIKKTLIAYLKTGEGAGLGFVNDRRNKEQVYRLALFSGRLQASKKRKSDLAVILTKQDDTGNTQERILVVGYDEESDEAKIMFNEAFYSSKLLIDIYGQPGDQPEVAGSLAKFITPATQLIEVKSNNGHAIYLYYDAEFDTMKREVFSEYVGTGEIEYK